MQTAVVTGATGFVATQLIKQLLEKGYHVRGSVRSMSKQECHSTLTALSNALPGTLELFEADLCKEGSFDAAMKGADVVFHIASPFIMQAENDPYKELIEPAVQGTLNVLSSVAKSKDSVRRIVLTASTASNVGFQHKAPPRNGRAYDESDWNETSTLETEAYQLSKVEAEKAAWRFAKENDLDLVTILPSFVMGPVLSPGASGTSVDWMRTWVSGGEVPFSYFSFADVRDVARAHVLAVEIPAAAGRYIVAQPGTAELSQIAKSLQERFPDYVVQDTGDWPKGDAGMDSGKAARELSLRLRPQQETFVDMAVSLLALGAAKPQLKAVIKKQRVS